MKILHRFLLAAALVSGAAFAAPDATDFLKAVQMDDEATVRTMLAAQADPNAAEPSRGENALILALRDKAMRTFHLLLADPRIKVDQPAKNGNTALMMAAFTHNKPAALDLIAHGAAVNKPGWTPLHYAAAAGDDEIVALLLDRKADINARSPDGMTPLAIAAREGHDRTAGLLRQRGATPVPPQPAK